MVAETVVIALSPVPVIPGMVDDSQVIIDFGRNVTGHGQHQVFLGFEAVIACLYHGCPQVIFQHIIIGEIIRQLAENRQGFLEFPLPEPTDRLLPFFRLGSRMGLLRHDSSPHPQKGDQEHMITTE